MSDTNQEATQSLVQPMNPREVIPASVVGASVGFITAAVYYLLTSFVMPALFCHDVATSVCTSAPLTLEGVALIVGAIAGLFGLIRLRVFRPLLVVLATTLSLGGVAQPLGTLAWYWALVATVLLFAFAYAVYVWIAQLRAFWIALVVTVILVIVTRLVLFS
jgi:hypothetical protein